MTTNISKKSATNGFQLSVLALSVASALPMQTAIAEEVKQLPAVKISEQDINETREDYKVDDLSSHKYSRPLAETPKTITVISEAVMKDRGATTLTDTLRGVSGIAMSAGEGGDPTGDNLTIRGFSAKTDLFIDGIRDIAGYSRDMYNVETVEVSKGPGSSVTGRGSVGGAVNLSTKSARLETFTDMSVLAGTENNHRLTLDTNQILGETTAIRFNAMTTDGDVAGRDDVENQMNAGALSLATGLGTGTRLTLSAEYQKQDNLPDYGLPWINNYSNDVTREFTNSLTRYSGGPGSESLFDNFYGNTHRDFEDIEAKNLNAALEHDLSEDTMLRLQMRYSEVERQSITTAPRFLTRNVGGVDIYGLDGIRFSDEKTRDQETSMLAFQAALIGQAGKHDYSVGTEYYLEEEDRWTLSDFGTDNLIPLANDYYNPNSGIAYNGHYSRTGEKTTGRSKTFALYGFDTYSLTDKWILNGGLRYENYKSDNGYADGSTASRSDNMYSWNVGAVYKVRPNGNIYASVGRSFNPSAEDLTASSTSNENDLDPEKSIGYEVGTKWELFEDRLLVSAALFETIKTNARTDDPLSTGNPETLDGEQRVRGLELSAFGQINDKFSITASYTYQDSEVTKAGGADAVQEGNELTRTPENSFSLWASYQPTAKWTMGAGYQYVDERYNSSDPGSRETAPDYDLFDMMVSYRVSNQLTLQLNGNNITDERYVATLGGGHFVPGAGRSYNLSAFYSF